MGEHAGQSATLFSDHLLFEQRHTSHKFVACKQDFFVFAIGRQSDQ